jgi:starvation-inducible outer membrane lipoprotein
MMRMDVNKPALCRSRAWLDEQLKTGKAEDVTEQFDFVFLTPEPHQTLQKLIRFGGIVYDTTAWKRGTLSWVAMVPLEAI